MEDDIFHIKTIQPFLVFETKKFYQRVIASCGISHFYSFSGSDKTVSVPFLADGCSNIIFCYDRGNVNAYVLGQTLEQGVFTIKSGADYFGIRFQPGENPCFEDLDVKDMAGKELLLSDFSNRLHSLQECVLLWKNTGTTETKKSVRSTSFTDR